MFDGININTEDAVVEETQINDCPATYFIDNQGYCCIIWDDGNYIFRLSANITKDTLIKIAESVQRIESD